MPYYLSKTNREFIVPFMERLVNCTNTISFETPDPERLAYILRTALNTEWSYLKEEFSIYTRETKVTVRRKIPIVNSANENIPIVDGDLFLIANDIMNKVPFPRTRYSKLSLTDDDVSSIISLATAKNLKYRVENNYLEIYQL